MVNSTRAQRPQIRRLRAFLLMLFWGLLLGCIVAVLKITFGISRESYWSTVFGSGIYGTGMLMGIIMFNTLIARGKLQWFVHAGDATRPI